MHEDGTNPLSIDLLISIAMGLQRASLLFFINSVEMLSWPVLFLDFMEFRILIISLGSVGAMYIVLSSALDFERYVLDDIRKFVRSKFVAYVTEVIAE